MTVTDTILGVEEVAAGEAPPIHGCEDSATRQWSERRERHEFTAVVQTFGYGRLHNTRWELRNHDGVSVLLGTSGQSGVVHLPVTATYEPRNAPPVQVPRDASIGWTITSADPPTCRLTNDPVDGTYSFDIVVSGTNCTSSDSFGNSLLVRLAGHVVRTLLLGGDPETCLRNWLDRFAIREDPFVRLRPDGWTDPVRVASTMLAIAGSGSDEASEFARDLPFVTAMLNPARRPENDGRGEPFPPGRRPVEADPGGSFQPRRSGVDDAHAADSHQVGHRRPDAIPEMRGGVF